MPTHSSSTSPRVPEATQGIQVNFCKNMACGHFGTPASTVKQKRGQYTYDGYIIGTKKGQRVRIKCRQCGQYSSLKSNVAIAEEFDRIWEYLIERPSSPVCCPTPSCRNHLLDVRIFPKCYHRFGETASGSKRFRCKACKKTFTGPSKPTAKQRLAHKNKILFKLVVNKEPIKRICEVLDIGVKTVYDKIDFFHRQCLVFAGSRERQLLNRLEIPRLYIASDRQEFTVNWTNTRDKRNVILKAVASADTQSGYVFGMHLNFDPRLDPIAIEKAALEAGDHLKSLAYRDHARIWLECDHAQATRIRNTQDEAIPEGALLADIARRYEGALQRDEIEASDGPEPHIALPARGMQVHEEYTLYAHFLFLKRLLARVGKVRFYLDQDSGMRAACLSAFKEDVLDARCDAFYVRVNKDLTIHEKQKIVARGGRDLDALRDVYPYLSDQSIRHLRIIDELKRLEKIGRWEDRWLNYPFPDMSEPEKAVCYLTDRNDYDEDRLARLYGKASLHAVDSYFNQIRTRLSALDRPKGTPSNRGRKWCGYQPYNPAMVQKHLDIFRTYYNFCLKSKKDKATPAMRLGLAKAPIEIDAILNFNPTDF